MSTLTYYLGIDVSKGYADFIILDRQKQAVEFNFQLDDTFEGHAKLHRILADFLEKRPEASLHAAVESTGAYENNWLHALRQFRASLNLRVARLNPLGVKANREAGLNELVTDPLSARYVAEYLITHPEKVNYEAADLWIGLRKQWRFYQLLNKQHTQLRNHMESLIYTSFPELMSYCKSEMPAWVLKLLKDYPTAASLARARIKKVAKIPYVSQERAAELIATAKKSVASATDKTTEQMVESLATQLLELENTIKIQSQQLIAAHPFAEEVALLTTFQGIGTISAIGLMLEIQAISRFLTPKNLASFFGLHPIYKQSGDGSWGNRMSKRGRVEPRRILFMVALNAIQTNEHIQEIYNKHVESGMKKKAALGVCMHKIIRIVYGMLKHKQAYDPAKDRQNQDKSAPKKEPTPTDDKGRRYQSHDKKAPISRRQATKREKSPLSQKAASKANFACAQGKSAKVDNKSEKFDFQRAANLTNKRDTMALIKQFLS